VKLGRARLAAWVPLVGRTRPTSASHVPEHWSAGTPTSGTLLVLTALLLCLRSPALCSSPRHPAPRLARRQSRLAQPDGTIVAEAEEFVVGGPPEASGWRPRAWGTNYFAGSIGNTFLSRKAYLGAPEQCPPSMATIEVEVPRSAKYLALVRYEAPCRFEARFRLRSSRTGTRCWTASTARGRTSSCGRMGAGWPRRPPSVGRRGEHRLGRRGRGRQPGQGKGRLTLIAEAQPSRRRGGMWTW